MDRFAFAQNLQAAHARVAAGQRALLEQRLQIRELEDCGLDATPARALLHVYEESQEMNIFERNRLMGVLASGVLDAPSRVDYDDRGLDEHETFDEDFYHRQAA
ncbi:MAG: hypothetical protein ACOY4R_24550 [Pseudomonadota bacterium]